LGLIMGFGWIRSGGAILCFHSITTADLPANGDAHVSLEEFRHCVAIARQVGELVPLSELVRRHRAGRSTAGLIAVTFDDAYAALRAEFRDFVTRARVPVAVFVVNQAAATGSAYWWDRIDDLFPRVAAGRWRMFEQSCGLPEAYRRGQPPEYGPLRPLRQWVLAGHVGRWPRHLDAALQALEDEVGARTAHRPMTFEELAELADGTAGIEIGVHTVSHPVLPLMDDGMLQEEIAGAYRGLQDRFSNVLPVLAIPFGLYDERTVRAARSAGMLASLTLAGETLGAHRGADALPRLCITRRDTRSGIGLRLLGLPGIVRRWSLRSRPSYPALPSATT
jgi:peptidoglycan/xylan/chitin deacetylase (PgdA/CDA1 family)